MYLVREVFHTKPGKAKEFVKKLKQAAPYFDETGMGKYKVLTDIATTYWTVVIETEVEDLGQFAKELRGGGKPQPELEKIMEGYMELIDGGFREIFLIE